MKNFLLGLIILSTSACAIAPLSTDMPARSIGKNRLFMSGGMSHYRIPDFKIGGGLTEDFDLWAHVDLISYGIGGRYSFINNERGFSFALVGGLGTSFGGNYYFAGPAISFKGESWEPYGVLRYNYADVDEDKYNDFLDSVFKTNGTNIGSLDFSYLQLAVGSRYWLKPKLYIGGEVNILSSFEDKIVFKSSGLVVSAFVGGLIYKDEN